MGVRFFRLPKDEKLKKKRLIDMRRENLQKQPPGVFLKKGVLKNFEQFTGKHQCWSLILKKLQS